MLVKMPTRGMHLCVWGGATEALMLHPGKPVHGERICQGKHSLHYGPTPSTLDIVMLHHLF
jgi:hypothetical protein